MPKEHQINKITDTLDLSEDEFKRMLPDFVAWWQSAKAISARFDVKHTGFVWIDDGSVGIDNIKITDAETGEVFSRKIQK